MIDDPRYCTIAARFKNANDWFSLRANALRDKPTDYWLKALAAEDVPAMICHTIDSLPHDEHLSQVGLLASAQHPTEGDVTMIRPTILVDGAPLPSGHAAHPLGWDTRGVLAEFGVPADEIDSLLASGAAVDGRTAAAVVEPGE